MYLFKKYIIYTAMISISYILCQMWDHTNINNMNYSWAQKHQQSLVQ